MGAAKFHDEMTPRERLEAVLTGKPYDRVPCSINASHQAGKLAGINHWESYFSAEYTARTQIEAHRVFGAESVGTGPGLHGIAEAAGSKVVYPKAENSPYITEHAVRQYTDLDRLEIPDPWTRGRLPVHLNALQILGERLGESVPVVSNVGGPFTAAANIRGTEAFLRDLYHNPKFVHRLLKFALDSTVVYVKEAAKLGATINIADPTASATLISPKQFREFAFPYLRDLTRIVTELTGKAPSLHICGNTKKIWQDMADTGAGILSLDDTVDLAAAKQEVGGRVAILGNVKPTATMYLGTPDDVIRDAKECLRKAHDNPKGYILALGCGMPLGAPVENIHAIFRAAREYGRYPIDPERLN
ncbi:MAG TPA: uroporphyrinogen decarboxylase family protein [Methylomusa anaerophila]|uniref:Uroporphyrinogen decarboxylase n=1 Tax=Methylomusa anaerophila TaxID=1930071 RepID=A0A348AEU9_9FIRM|nr:uroporphyrinogen decarboxylase family protein [Methylomusa anaerophila]BBB89597.1 uroporphyrinogen decarboxylase [Methylomusa anaerophila]HML89630.1 uroporphyrinogen decarboxylase family protein [Methylomusa anaerophila]